MKKEAILIILITLILIILFSGTSLGKYFSKTNLEVKYEIAKPILKIEGDSVLNINRVKEETYKFKIKNYDETNQITEVDLEYYIEIISGANENFNFKIYKDNVKVNINGNKTEKFLLSKEEKQEDNYKIEILFNNISVQEIMQNIEIKVYSEQKNK